MPWLLPAKSLAQFSKKYPLDSFSYAVLLCLLSRKIIFDLPYKLIQPITGPLKGLSVVNNISTSLLTT